MAGNKNAAGATKVPAGGAKGAPHQKDGTNRPPVKAHS